MTESDMHGIGKSEQSISGDVEVTNTVEVIRKHDYTLSNSGVKSADTLIKNGAGAVYWLTVSDTAALLIELNDSLDNSGTDKWALILPADGYAHFIFDPPLIFGTGIYLDVSTATCKVIIEYI